MGELLYVRRRVVVGLGELAEGAWLLVVPQGLIDSGAVGVIVEGLAIAGRRRGREVDSAHISVPLPGRAVPLRRLREVVRLARHRRVCVVYIRRGRWLVGVVSVGVVSGLSFLLAQLCVDLLLDGHAVVLTLLDNLLRRLPQETLDHRIQTVEVLLGVAQPLLGGREEGGREGGREGGGSDNTPRRKQCYNYYSGCSLSDLSHIPRPFT